MAQNFSRQRRLSRASKAAKPTDAPRRLTSGCDGLPLNTNLYSSEFRLCVEELQKMNVLERFSPLIPTLNGETCSVFQATVDSKVGKTFPLSEYFAFLTMAQAAQQMLLARTLSLVERLWKWRHARNIKSQFGFNFSRILNTWEADGELIL